MYRASRPHEALVRSLRALVVLFLSVSAIWISFVLISSGTPVGHATSLEATQKNRYLEALQQYGPGSQFYRHLAPPYSGIYS